MEKKYLIEITLLYVVIVSKTCHFLYPPTQFSAYVIHDCSHRNSSMSKTWRHKVILPITVTAVTLPDKKSDNVLNQIQKMQKTRTKMVSTKKSLVVIFFKVQVF